MRRVGGVEATRYRVDAVAAAWHRGNAGEPTWSHDAVDATSYGSASPTPENTSYYLAVRFLVRGQLLHAVQPSLERGKIRQPAHGPRVTQRLRQDEVRGRRALDAART